MNEIERQDFWGKETLEYISLIGYKSFIKNQINESFNVVDTSTMEDVIELIDEDLKLFTLP